MSNAIGRKRLFGIAIETGAYGVAQSSPTYVLPLLDTPRIEIVQNKEENTAALGSNYAVNTVDNTTRMANLSLNVKVDEDHIPLFFKQRFSIASGTVSGDATAYEHVLSYSNTTTTSFTVFVYDPDRTSVKAAGFKFENLNLFAEQGYYRIEATGKGKFTSTWTGSTSATQPSEFVGRNASVLFAQYPTATTSIPVLRSVFNHTFGLSDDEFNFVLGDGDMTALELTEDRFEAEVTKRFEDFTYRDYWTNNNKLSWASKVEDTGRTIGSSSNPMVLFDYPVGYMTNWTEEGDLGTPLTEILTLLATDEVGVTNAPAKITVRNSVASY